MSEIIERVLTENELDELKNLLDPNEELQFLFTSNTTPRPFGREHYYCKNGHWNFISNYMAFHPNTIIKIKCSECDEIIYEFKPMAVRIRELHIKEIIK